MIALLFALTTMWLCDDQARCIPYTITPITTSTTTTTVPTTTTTLAARAIQTWGYLGVYDQNGATVTTWPTKLTTILAGPDGQGALIATAKQRALAAGNASAKFLFYLSLGDMDSQCNCFESRLYASLDPAFTLKDANGNKVSTNNGIGRVYAMDIGNPAFTSAWTRAVQAEILLHSWDGVLADNVNRCNGFWGWSAKPVNPRTGLVYTCADYRRDLGVALAQIHLALGQTAKLLVGNHGGAWNDVYDGSHTFQDPLIRAQVDALDGVQLEDCVFQMNGAPYNETAWLDQLHYLQYANGKGKRVLCEAYGGVLGDQVKRTYALATELLTAQDGSALGQLNSVSAWSTDYERDLGVALAPVETWTSTAGVTYYRRFTKATVAVNPGSVSRSSPCGILPATSGAFCPPTAASVTFTPWPTPSLPTPPTTDLPRSWYGGPEAPERHEGPPPGATGPGTGQNKEERSLP